MNTYYLKINAVPTELSDKFEVAKDALVCCWIKAKSPRDAMNKTIFAIERDDWRIIDIELYPSEVTREDFLNRDIGLDAYEKAQNEGAAIVYAAVARDGKTSYGPEVLERGLPIEKSAIIEEFKRNKRKKTCLHYDAGDECTEFINAHSIQKKGLLSQIAVDGHVYRVNRSLSPRATNSYLLTCDRTGVNKLSTFGGFCQKHDNELFKSIDTCSLIPTEEQAFLYAYRSLCKELTAKGMALQMYEYLFENFSHQPTLKNMFKNSTAGSKWGLDNLNNHKLHFDNSLRKSTLGDIQYLVFSSPQKPNIVFSGLIYPDFDFIGNELQQLDKMDSRLDLLTYCSAPMKGGWGFLLGWHKSSSKTCVEYVNSLVSATKTGASVEDMLFRLVVRCENHAISPKWWDSLEREKKDAIIERMTDAPDVHAEILENYLQEGLEGASGWTFDSVTSNIGNEMNQVPRARES